MGYDSEILNDLSHGLGWSFTILSPIGFFPQVMRHHLKRSVAGFDLSLLIFEVIDSVIYFCYTICLFCVPNTQRQYKDAEETKAIPVALYDVAVSCFVLAVIVWMVGQYAYFRDGNNKIGAPFIFLIAIVSSTILIMCILCGLNVCSPLNLIMYIPYVRLPIALFKFVPQIKLNHEKNECGLSTYMVVLETIVGLAIVGQMSIDRYNYQDWTLITGNFSKFFDGFCTLLSNLAFILQIYQYRKHSLPNSSALSRNILTRSRPTETECLINIDDEEQLGTERPRKNSTKNYGTI